MKLVKTAKLRGSTIGRTSVPSGLSSIKYKLKMEKWPPKSPESKFPKKLMLLHIIFASLSDETLGLKIYRVSFLISIVQSKKKLPKFESV